MVLAAFLFMKRMADVTNVSAVTREFREEGGNDAVRTRLPAGVEVYEINGPFFFGAAAGVKDTLARVVGKPKVLIIGMRNVPAMDATGLHALRDLVRRSRGDGTRVLLAGVHAQPMVALGKSPLLDELGDENLVGSVAEGTERAREIIAGARTEEMRTPPGVAAGR
jgi:SulP family sulfate permease